MFGQATHSSLKRLALFFEGEHELFPFLFHPHEVVFSGNLVSGLRPVSNQAAIPVE